MQETEAIGAQVDLQSANQMASGLCLMGDNIRYQLIASERSTHLIATVDSAQGQRFYQNSPV